ncbi:MAG: hypothetical protein J7647_16865 [Cyanobacteria bacterium SBLK]|nr:hypothetical protein [Cyanobacteria bacterium SBLK]
MPVIQEKYSWFDVSEEIKRLLILASENWENTQLSEHYMKEALEKAGDNLQVLIGAYRFFFYQKNPAIALNIAERVIKIITVRENLPSHWLELEPILERRKEEENLRLYLNAYAGKGYMLAKLGKIEEAKLITERVKKIDTNRETCATTIYDVLTSPPEEED